MVRLPSEIFDTPLPLPRVYVHEPLADQKCSYVKLIWAVWPNAARPIGSIRLGTTVFIRLQIYFITSGAFMICISPYLNLRMCCYKTQRPICGGYRLRNLLIFWPFRLFFCCKHTWWYFHVGDCISAKSLGTVWACWCWSQTHAQLDWRLGPLGKCS